MYLSGKCQDDDEVQQNPQVYARKAGDAGIFSMASVNKNKGLKNNNTQLRIIRLRKYPIDPKAYQELCNQHKWVLVQEHLILLQVNNKGRDKPVYPCSLISTLVILC